MYCVARKISPRDVFGSAPLTLFISSAQVLIAPSICFMLAMQAFFWLTWRALIKLGIAIAASKPMIATTIMISTSVNPALLLLLIFISYLSLSAAWTNVKGMFYEYCVVHKL